MEMTSLRNDDEEPEDVIMKESIVTNVSEGKPSDFRFELNEYIEHETKAESQENIPTSADNGMCLNHLKELMKTLSLSLIQSRKMLFLMETLLLNLKKRNK